MRPGPGVAQPACAGRRAAGRLLALRAGALTLTGLDTLTGLPEYRNGGLLIDLGLLTPRDEAWLQAAHMVGEPAVVEWRGTWAAGRRIAAERRAGGGPPFALASDGTVF